tara:strand:- start:47 stop:208 length:162 start_codon:yes stop_codon:yes gene_type:complete
MPEQVSIYEVYVDTEGIAPKRLNKRPSKVTGNQLTFTISTTRQKAGIVAYELV